ncbi:MAG: hypothetical protein GYB67_02605, partial [Chloroflexi bacterium]|nr:hypothetical protein [Chloroflexota bacterium]
PTLLIAATLLMALIAKLSISGNDPILRPREFGTFVLNVGMFILPLIAVGMIRAKKSRATAPAILGALIAGVYFAAFWFVEQQ